MPTITFAQRNAQLDRQNAETMARIARETETSSLTIQQATGATAGGDSRKLRGIPAIGPGVTGAIPGTIPGNLR